MYNTYHKKDHGQSRAKECLKINVHIIFLHEEDSVVPELQSFPQSLSFICVTQIACL